MKLQLFILCSDLYLWKLYLLYLGWLWCRSCWLHVGGGTLFTCTWRSRRNSRCISRYLLAILSLE